mmetsp:Transcript_66122/g.149260  ORF Transcript_66122/g.149260 Transcript_66122/m.149260 type:complete len:150 (+) Transcript_66122:30-479(+)
MDRGFEPVEVDLAKQRYPYSIVWGPLGPLTCCCPCVGHMGIGDSKGKIHDFNGPFSIGIDNFMVGCVWRYAVVKQTGKKDSFTAEEWDAAIAKADAKYSKLNHNICCQNCHHHTADAISLSGRPMGEGNLGLLNSWIYCCIHGKFTCCG